MRLVYLSPIPWESFAQRPHKFVEWFHYKTGGPVLWVDPYPARFPSLKDFQRLRMAAPDIQHTNTPPWLTELKPAGLPIEPLPASGYINSLLWRPLIRRITNFVIYESTFLVVGKPSILALVLLKRLQGCRSLYDAMDDFPAFFEGLSHHTLMRREREVAHRVDVIWASSSVLKDRWARLHKDVRLVHNALDLAAIQSIKLTAKSSTKRIFGYVGTIASWFDWQWLCTLAHARRNDEIRLIGPILENPPCDLPGNVRLFPACNHASALGAMSQFHVGLIPFRKNILTDSVDPIKYYEYCALGLPIISTDFGEMKLRTSERGVFITRSLSDVSIIADAAIQFGSNACLASDFALRNSWESRFDAAKLLQVC